MRSAVWIVCLVVGFFFLGYTCPYRSNECPKCQAEAKAVGEAKEYTRRMGIGWCSRCSKGYLADHPKRRSATYAWDGCGTTWNVCVSCFEAMSPQERWDSYEDRMKAEKEVYGRREFFTKEHLEELKKRIMAGEPPDDR